jgi:hypothetical protein
MDGKDSTKNSGNDKQLSKQTVIDAKAKLEKQKKLATLEKLIEEADQQGERRQKIYDNVEKESKKTFTDIPLTTPSSLDLQNPAYAHNLIYKQLNPLKRAFIPKGKDGQEIRNEINLFLKEGYKIGRHSNQAYIHLMIEAVNTFKQWVNEFGGKQIAELFNRFYDINKRLGFRK